MLSPARLTQLLMEVVFILLGALVVWLGIHDSVPYPSAAYFIVSLALIGWGVMAFVRPVQRWNIWEKWNRGISLILIGLIMLAMTRVPVVWVPRLLIGVGAILVTRGLFACLMIFKQS